jgi:hypothetical protein
LLNFNASYQTCPQPTENHHWLGSEPLFSHFFYHHVLWVSFFCGKELSTKESTLFFLGGLLITCESLATPDSSMKITKIYYYTAYMLKITKIYLNPPNLKNIYLILNSQNLASIFFCSIRLNHLAHSLASTFRLSTLTPSPGF